MLPWALDPGMNLLASLSTMPTYDCTMPAPQTFKRKFKKGRARTTTLQAWAMNANERS